MPQLIVVFHNNNNVFLIDGLVAVLCYPFSSARLPFPPHLPHLYSSVATLLHVTARRPALESIHDGTVVAALVASTQTHVALLVSSIITYFPLVAGRISLLVGKECQQG